ARPGRGRSFARSAVQGSSLLLRSAVGRGLDDGQPDPEQRPLGCLVPSAHAVRQHLHGLLLAAEEAGPQPLFQGLVDARPARHAAVLPLDAQQCYLQVEESLVFPTHLAQGVPVLRAQPAGVRPPAGEGLACHLLVDARQAVVELVLLVEPDAADLLRLVGRDEAEVAELLGPLAAGAPPGPPPPAGPTPPPPPCVGRPADPVAPSPG